MKRRKLRQPHIAHIACSLPLSCQYRKYPTKHYANEFRPHHRETHLCGQDHSPSGFTSRN